MRRSILTTLGSVGLVWLGGILAGGRTVTQAQGPSASDLIRFITYQSGRPDFGLRAMVLSCGVVNRAAQDDRRAANALVSLGASAIPEIESALASLEKEGMKSPFFFNGTWLLIAYARILGPKAYPRLERLLASPALGVDYALDASIATSLQLTSYVESSAMVRGAVLSCSSKEPRDALDRLLLAWEKNDRAAVEESLGPAAKAALESLLKGQTWQQFRAGFWHGGSRGSVAVGYRFETNGAWAQPRVTLNEAAAMSRIVVDLSAIPLNPQIEARFADKRGQECGAQRVRFYTSHDSMSRLIYFVDNPDLSDLLRLVSRCANQAA